MAKQCKLSRHSLAVFLEDASFLNLASTYVYIFVLYTWVYIFAGYASSFCLGKNSKPSSASQQSSFVIRDFSELARSSVNLSWKKSVVEKSRYRHV